MNISVTGEYINTLCIDITYTNWRGDLLNKFYATFCLTLLSFNTFAVVKSLLRKRETNSARLFVFAFCGNICCTTAAFITTILRFKGSLSCKARKWLFVIFQYGMTSSSYALLILISINIIITKKSVMLTQKEKKRLAIKILTACFFIAIVSLVSSLLIFVSHRLAFRSSFILQFVADFTSIAQCFRLSQVFKQLTSHRNCQINSSFMRQANRSRKTILPAVATSNAFKAIYYIQAITVRLIKLDKTTIIILEHVKTIYFFGFFIVPCLHLYNIRNRNRKEVVKSSQEPERLPKRSHKTNQIEIFTAEHVAAIHNC